MGYTATVGFAFGLLLLISQRIVARHRRLFRGFVLLMALGLFIRGNRVQENITGLIMALVLNYLYWLLIGRYNPVGNNDEAIKVYGMDD